jgi:chromosome segregation ATPase
MSSQYGRQWITCKHIDERQPCCFQVLGELESNAQAREKVIQDLNGRIFQLQGEIERLESNLTKKQIETNGLNSTLSDLASKCKDLQGALSQVSKDLDAANQSTQDLESKRAGLEKAKTKLEAAVYEGGKQLQAKDREAIECKQQLKVALDEIEALKKQLKGRASHDAAVESEQSDLRRQLAALSLDRDNLAQAAAQLAEARADFETQNTHSPSKQLGLRGAQDDNSHLQNEIQRLGKNLGDAQAEIENLRLNLYNLQEKSNQKQQAQRAAPMPPTLAIFSETSLEKCCKLVGLIQKRVDENHLADHDIVTTVSSEATTVRHLHRDFFKHAVI